MSSHDSARPNRREFLHTSTAAVAAGALTAGLASSVHAAGSDVIRVGLVGCGGRGSGAAAQALTADSQVHITALGDAFSDRLASCRRRLKSKFKDRAPVDESTSFVGFDAYKNVIANCDVVLLATPPHFRPEHLKAAIGAGKHVFCEKPVCVDGAGARSVFETVKLAKEKNLSLVSGLCWRYHHTIRATFDQVFDGAIGDIQAMSCGYNTNGLWNHDRKPEWSEMEYQLRNWLYYTWASGDFITEQHVHSLDKMTWAMHGAHPIKASATGGRQVRTGAKYGHVYDHFAVEFEYENGVKAFSRCRQQNDTQTDVSDHLFGTKGVCHIVSANTSIEGEKNWKYAGPGCNMYQVEHDFMFKAIRDGKPINNGDYMTVSSLMAVLGREAAYTGQTITWDQLLNSKTVLAPLKDKAGNPRYEWTKVATPSVAMPGVTKFS